MSPELTTRARPEPASSPPPVDPRIQARRDQVEQEGAARRRRRLIIVAIVFSFVAAGWFVTHSPLLDVDHLVVTASPHVPAEQVVAVAGVHPGQHLVDVDEAAAARRLRALPWVGDAKVSVGWNGTAHLSVTERVPVVAVAAGPGRWILTDAKGKAVAPVSAVPPGIIAVTGVAPAAAGATFGPALSAPLELVAHLTPGLRTRIASVVVGTDGAIGMTLNPSGVVQLCQPTSLAEKLSSLTTFFARVDDRGLGVVNACIPDAIYVSGRTS